MAEEEKPEEKETKEYKLVQVPTQMGLAIQNPTGETFSQEQAVVDILNKLEKIEKAVA